jgi:peptidoglycan biosynthesis protein MviN/MurJ (putative lipid II flippase)
LIAPLIVVFLPLLSALPGVNDPRFASRTALAAETAFVLSTIAALLTAVFARPLSALLFGYGAMAGEGADSIAATAAVLMSGLPFMAIFQIMAVALNATERTRLVMVFSVIALVVALGLYTALLFLGLRADMAAMLGFSAFSLVACLLSMHRVLGMETAGNLLLSFLGKSLVQSAIIAPVALLLPWVRDEKVTLSDVAVVFALALILLMIHRNVFFALAATRDERTFPRDQS